MTRSSEATFAIDEELRTSIHFIKSGLAQLQNLDSSNDFYQQFISSLASGFERFMKVTLCFDALERTGEYPPQSEAIYTGTKGHNLGVLLERVLCECFKTEYARDIPAARLDIEHLRSPELRRIIEIFSQYGQAGRYHDINTIIGKKNQAAASPAEKWRALELEIAVANGWLSEITSNPATTIYKAKINREIIICLERYIRAVSRLYTIGGLGNEAKRFSSYLHSFLFLMDDELGESIYLRSGELR